MATRMYLFPLELKMVPQNQSPIHQTLYKIEWNSMASHLSMINSLHANNYHNCSQILDNFETMLANTNLIPSPF